MSKPAAGFRRVKRGRYWSYQLDGQRLPSVTKLIGDGVPKPALIDWAARMAAEYAADHADEIGRLDRAAAVDLVKMAHRRSTNAAAARGTEIHGFADALIAGATIEVPEAIVGYVDAYRQFLDDWQPDVVATEGAVCSRRWLYAGTFDLLARLPAFGAEPFLIDIKTGGSGIWPEACLQVAAYRSADVYVDNAGDEHPMPPTGGGLGLQLIDDGSYELVPLESGPDIFAVFLHAAHVAAFCARGRDALIGVPMPVPEAA